jgi:DNA polymerase
MTSKTSTAKYAALLHRSTSDGFIRDTLLFHVASTGRWGGSGFQPQNLPKPTKALGDFDPEVACEVINDESLERVRLFYGSPMDAFSGVVRSMIVPRPGYKFVCSDFSAIEARVLFWLAGHAEGVKAYEQNAPIYEEMASEIFGRPVTRQDEAERDIGKRTILGCGYGMGAKKFHATCEQFNQPITMELAEKSVALYREKHWPVPRLWSNLNQAAIHAIQKPMTKVSINKTIWFFDKKDLWCRLPSGRSLCYPDASVKFETVFGQKRPVVCYYGMNNVTRKWDLDKTYGGKLTENVTQAVARDFMANAILNFATKPELKSKYILSLHVHDELVGETKTGNIEEFKNAMTARPTWGVDCPIAAGGWEGLRYRK